MYDPIYLMQGRKREAWSKAVVDAITPLLPESSNQPIIIIMEPDLVKGLHTTVVSRLQGDPLIQALKDTISCLQTTAGDN